MRVFAVGLALLALTTAGDANGQSPVAIYGTVRTAETGLALPYSVVSIPSLGREQFTNDRGGFSLRELPLGALTLRFRHIGFSPRDTQVVLRAGDTLRIEMSLQRLAIRLEAMHVTASCDNGGDAAGTAALAELFEQVRQNASQYRLLVRSHPFTRRMSRTDVVRMTDGQYAAGMPQIINVEAKADASYRPGRVFRFLRGSYHVVLPTLPDFADSVFIANHCFSYGGEAMVDSTRFVKVAFSPVAGLKELDIEGTVTLRAEGYGIAIVELRTTGVPKNQADLIKSVRVVTQFQDVLPGIAVVSRVESFIEPGPKRAKAEPKVASRGEIQMLEEIKWKNGPP